MEQTAIIELQAQKHVKIYLLHKEGLSNKQIAEALKTNVGHVYNVLKDYRNNPDKVNKANAPVASMAEARRKDYNGNFDR